MSDKKNYRRDKRAELDIEDIYEESTNKPTPRNFSYKLFCQGHQMGKMQSLSLYRVGQKIQYRDKIFKIREIFWHTHNMGDLSVVAEKS